MKNILFRVIPAVGVIALASMASAAPFTLGNLVVSRVGDGTAALTGNATAVFLDEYTTAGTAVGNTIPLPTVASGGNFALTLGGTTTSAGHLARSTNGQFLTIFGVDAPVGTTTPNGNTSFRGRTVAYVNQAGVVNTATRFDAGGTTPRMAFTTNGTDTWIASDVGAGSTGALRYITAGSTTNGVQLNSTTTNIRTVNVANGQLYIGSSTGVGGDFRGVSAVGTGTPTSSAAFSLLTGMGRLGGLADNGNTDSTYDFYFHNADTVYVTDDDLTAPASGGVQKWVRSGTTWSKVWTVTGATTPWGARSITGRNLPGSTTSVELFAIAAGVSGTGSSDLIRIVDTGSGTPTATVLATAATNTVFRGVEMIPEPTTLGLLAGVALLASRRRRA
jgi:hypothetical protein